MAQRRSGLGHSVCLGADRARRRYDMSQPLALEGLGRMSRMTFLEGEIWLGAEPGRGLPRFVRAPEAGYPPYNIELLTGEDGSPSALRITLAVAGFGVDELAVTIEGGQLIVRGKQADERSRDYIYRESRPEGSSAASGSQTASRCARPNCTTGCSPSSSSGR
jgi:HSP20 family molecular chaperone IbpA